MDHEGVALQMRHGAVAQPVEQVLAIGGVEDVLEGVFLSHLGLAACDRQHVQVMVPQRDHRAIPQAMDHAQDLEVLVAVVDQIPDEPQRVAARVEAHVVEQALEDIEASVDVAEDIGGHEIPCSVFFARLR